MMTKTKWILVLVCIVFSAGAYAVTSWMPTSNRAGDPRSVVDTHASASPTSEEWYTCINNRYKYTFKYPSSWHVYSQGELLVNLATEDVCDGNLVVTKYPIGSEMGYIDRAQFHIVAFRTTPPSVGESDINETEMGPMPRTLEATERLYTTGSQAGECSRVLTRTTLDGLPALLARSPNPRCLDAIHAFTENTHYRIILEEIDNEFLQRLVSEYKLLQ